MAREDLEEYLSEILNIRYYNEEELQKIYDVLKLLGDQIYEYTIAWTTKNGTGKRGL